MPFFNTEKFKDALEKGDELASYAELSYILETFVNWIKDRSEFTNNQDIENTVNKLTEVSTLASEVYLDLKDMKKERIQENLSLLEEIGACFDIPHPL